MDKEIEEFALKYRVNLKEVKGTGKGGKITIQDLERYIKSRYLPKIKKEEKIFGVRKIISERLAKSYKEAVHVTENIEVVADNLAAMRERLAKHFLFKPSYTVLLLKCVALVIRNFSDFNATFEEGILKIYEDININLAVDTSTGLVTPVIRNVDEKDLRYLLEEYKDIVGRSKKNQLNELDFMGGTFTVTNLGMYGIDSFTPIINPPQVAILGINGIKNSIRMSDKGSIESYKVMTLSLSFDHRVIDGARAAKFLAKMKQQVESPELLFSG